VTHAAMEAVIREAREEAVEAAMEAVILMAIDKAAKR
jgi:hypothetical protein